MGGEAELVHFCREDLEATRNEIRKVVIGQEAIIDGLLRGILCNGHVLVEGMPGVAKTLIVRTLAKVCGGKFSRIQFTVDLLPSDIIGITSYDPKSDSFSTVRGPIFTNYLMADEINRAPPKTQSAMLEAMQEKQVTIGKATFPLPTPFFVMATQNPLESQGVYPLPEAQLDRFLFKLLIGFPDEESELQVMDQNITLNEFSTYDIQQVLSPERIGEMQQAVKDVYTDDRIKKYTLQLISATREVPKMMKLGKYLEHGVSPRATINLHIAAKAQALLKGRPYVTPQDVKDVAADVLRHRIRFTYEGIAEAITPDQFIKELLEKVEVP